jgi:hypothetical protein
MEFWKKQLSGSALSEMGTSSGKLRTWATDLPKNAQFREGMPLGIPQLLPQRAFRR